MITGYYYLHENGSLIYKVGTDCVADFRESDFVKAFWPFDPEDRETAWNLLVESLAAGANKDRVMELAEKWGCTNEDATHYADRIKCSVGCLDDRGIVAIPSNSSRYHGEGSSALEAMARLCSSMGYKPQKTWGHTFKDLVEKANAE